MRYNSGLRHFFPLKDGPRIQMSDMTYYPLVSIIVPVFNVEDYLERCVSSITGQTYDNLEIILVDDGSTDSSGKLCDSIAAQDERISVIHSENRGLAGARNLGLTFIHGEWIVFVDSDDYIGPNHILNLLSAALGSNSLVSVTGRTVVTVAEKDRGSDPIVPSVVSTFDAEQAIYIAVTAKAGLFGPSAWGKLYHSSLAPLLIFPLGKYYEDQFVTYYVLDSAKTIAYENANDYYYLSDRPNSIMHRCDERVVDIFEGNKMLLQFSKDREMKEVEASITQLYYSHLIGYYALAIKNDQTELAEHIFQRIRAERTTALLSPYTARSTKIAMLLSFAPRTVFDRAIHSNESRADRS